MIRKVDVHYQIKVPGLTVSVPMRDTLVLEEGYTDESDIPGILAIYHWNAREQRHLDCLVISSVQPCMRKSGPIHHRRNVSEITLRDRRNQGNNLRRGDWLELESTNSLATLALAFSWQTKALPAEPSDSFGPLSDTFAHLPRIV